MQIYGFSAWHIIYLGSESEIIRTMAKISNKQGIVQKFNDCNIG